MKTTINRVKLLAALDAVSPGVSTSTTVPEMQAVKLSAAGDGVRVVSQNPQCVSEAFVAGNVEAEGSCLVPFHRLSAMLQGAAEDVSLEADDICLKIKMGKTKAQMPVYDIDAALNLVADASVAFVSISGKLLGEALMVATASAGDGKIQSWHEGVKIASRPDGIKILSGDGKQFSRILLTETASADFSLVMPEKALRRVLSQIHSSETVSLLFSNHSVTITCDGASHRIASLAHDFPDIEQVATRFDGECKHHAELKREALMHSLKMASVMTSELEYNVQMAATEDGFRLKSSLQSAGEYDDVLEAKIDGALNPTGINHKMLHSHLSALRCDDVSVWYYDGAFAFKVEPVGKTGWSWFSSIIRK